MKTGKKNYYVHNGKHSSNNYNLFVNQTETSYCNRK